MEKRIIIHGHFYQPPRENPWLEAIEIQDSAYPYHDWDSRIAAECYAPNTASHILDPQRRIIDICNNYSRISFNFGPTLLVWLQQYDPEAYEAIIQADKDSRERYSGHGSAIAQAYNHSILPLCNDRDKKTQVLWGIRDFQTRFGRDPEGIWIPEMAVNTDTLEHLAERGIKFTLLSPRQAKSIKKINEDNWTDVPESSIDPKRPYLCNLPSGKSIALFFYDGPIAHDIAFGQLLQNGEKFAQRLLSAFQDNGDNSQLSHIATDGETYGHHQTHGDMALAYCLYYLDKETDAKLSNYGEYLEQHAPEYEVQIVENSSWSCVHGIERWRNDCGCSTGGHPEWNQKWRAPLRGAMDWLRDNLIEIYEDHASNILNDPWQARDDYIDVILNRDPENINAFLQKHAGRELSHDEQVKALRLLEMQRHAMLMYTSCGWFFEEISGLMSVQVIQYAARAIQLAQEVSGINLQDAYKGLLERAPSNLPEHKNGADIYGKFVQPGVLNLLRVGGHYAINSLFKDVSNMDKTYTFSVKGRIFDNSEAGRHKLLIGSVHISSDITRNEGDVSFAALHLGGHNILSGALTNMSQDEFNKMRSDIHESFMKSDISQVIRLLDKYFKNNSFSLKHLFRDEQRMIIDQLLQQSSKDIEASFRQLYENQYPVIQALSGLSMPLPDYFSILMQFILNRDLRKNIEGDEIDFKAMKRNVEEIMRWPVQVDKNMLGYLTGNKINSLTSEWRAEPENVNILQTMNNILDILRPLDLKYNLWKSQVRYFTIGRQHFEQIKQRAQSGDKNAQKLESEFRKFGDNIRVKLE
jgi:alpha-amylase/alpha-mannosidase (GH57 family)